MPPPKGGAFTSFATGALSRVSGLAHRMERGLHPSFLRPDPQAARTASRNFRGGTGYISGGGMMGSPFGELEVEGAGAGTPVQ